MKNRKKKKTQEEIEDEIRLECLFICNDDYCTVNTNGWYDPYYGGRGSALAFCK